MSYLIKTTEVYRVQTEEEVKKLIEDAKADSMFEVSKYTSEARALKQKGEIIEEWFRVTITKNFNDEKEPAAEVSVEYEIN